MLTYEEKQIIKTAALRMYGIDMDALVSDTYSRRMMAKTASGDSTEIYGIDVPNTLHPDVLARTKDMLSGFNMGALTDKTKAFLEQQAAADAYGNVLAANPIMGPDFNNHLLGTWRSTPGYEDIVKSVRPAASFDAIQSNLVKDLTNINASETAYRNSLRNLGYAGAGILGGVGLYQLAKMYQNSRRPASLYGRLASMFV